MRTALSRLLAALASDAAGEAWTRRATLPWAGADPDRRRDLAVAIPPTSPLWSSGTDETVTLPSWEASAPIPRPAKQHRPGHDLGPAARVKRGHHDHDAAEQAEEPDLDHAAW
jgi:hypothetical protein